MTTVITAQGEATKKANAAKRSRPVAPATAKSKKSPTKPNRRARPRQGTKEPRTNKKAEVIAVMKRAKGATLAEIMEATGWQKHTVRGLVSVLGSGDGLKIESCNSCFPEASNTYKGRVSSSEGSWR